MRRVYVIMRDYLDEDGNYQSEPWDVTDSLAIAENICYNWENVPEAEGDVYYWKEVITTNFSA